MIRLPVKQFKMAKTSNFQWKTLLVFSFAMGFLEAIVVIYVRELYYPNGFEFPLKVLPPKIVFIEIVRELTTLVMLGSVAWMANKKFLLRFAAFLFLFGIWDIVFYAALKLLINWPASFFTWDILFLIPITWVGPVLAPLICSILMIIMGMLIVYLFQNKKIKTLTINEWSLLLSGATIIFVTFIFDFLRIIIKGHFYNNFLSIPNNPDFLSILNNYTPSHFLWGVFFIGILLIFFSIFLIIIRAKKTA